MEVPYRPDRDSDLPSDGVLLVLLSAAIALVIVFFASA